MSTPKIKLRNSERLSRQIMDLIIEGQLKPGDRIPTEHELMEQYQASRISVREALSILAGMGLIEQEQGARRRIRQIDARFFSRLFPLMVALDGNRTLRDVLHVRRSLEHTAVQSAARQRSDADLQKLRENIEAYGAILDSDEPDAEKLKKAVAVDCEFHILIARISGNTILPLLMEVLSRYVAEVQLKACVGDLSRNRLALKAHERICQQIEKGDPEAAVIEMAYHLQLSEESLTSNK